MKKNLVLSSFCWILITLLMFSYQPVACADFFRPDTASHLKPYIVGWSDHMAVRLLADGSIEATLEDYAQAKWDEVESEAEEYTEEDRAEIAEEIASTELMLSRNDYVSVAASLYGSLAAVHQDGTVSANLCSEQQCGLYQYDDQWTDIKQIALGAYTALGLKNDGTVVISGDCGTFSDTVGTHPLHWEKIASIANDMIAVGLREDGTVQYASWIEEPSEFGGYIPLNTISEWTDIVQVHTMWESVIGLRKDGTAVFAGDAIHFPADLTDWTDLVKVAVNQFCVIGLKKDGTLISTDDFFISDLNGEIPENVVDFYTSDAQTLVILADGSCRLLGEAEYRWNASAAEWVFPAE